MHRAEAEPVSSRPPRLETNPDVVSAYLEDAAHYPGGRARAVARPVTVEEVAHVVRSSPSVLTVGARSSLTGGATPANDVVISTERLTGLHVEGEVVRAGAGVTLAALQHALLSHGRWFPPVPTFMGATVGGIVATNAAGAATFKYGTVRRWVRALTVVLAGGDVLRLARGQVTSSSDGRFVIETSDGAHDVRVPDIRWPNVPKCSAGYYAQPHMDLVDLFVGSEGTLGVIVEVVLATAPRPAGVCWLFATLGSEDDAIALTRDLRDGAALDVAAIEHIDRRCIDMLREDRIDRRLGVSLPASAGVLLLAQLEVSEHDAADGLGDAALQELWAALERHGAADTAEVVLPSNHRRAEALVALREAVPSGVNRRVALAHDRDPRVHKTAADMIVPFDRFGEMMRVCRRLAAREGLDLAVWGHISDGNVHPNIIPAAYADVEKGRALILELGREVVALGGSPLAEHGVGRNPVKQRLLELLCGAGGVDAMRRVKLSLDPAWKLAPGVLFEKKGTADAR